MTFEEVQLRKRYYAIMQEYNGCLTNDEQRDLDWTLKVEACIIEQIRRGLSQIVAEEIISAEEVRASRPTTYSSPRPHISGGRLINAAGRPVKGRAA